MTTANVLEPELEQIEPELVEIADEDEDDEMAGLQHGEICALLIINIGQFVYANKLGRIYDGQTSFKVVGSPATRRPDISFVTSQRVPVDWFGPANFAPDLAIEVVSESDTDYEVDRKIQQYLQASVQVIWIVRPVSQTIEVFRLESGFRSHRLIIEDVLTEESLLPGFKMPVNAIFD